MRTLPPTQTKEDYLREIFRLYEKGEQLRLTDVAFALGLSKSTVSERVRELVDGGYLSQPKYAELHFTRKGLAVAKNLTHKHRLIEVFLHEKLHIPKNQVHAEAHRLEHGLSDMVAKRLSEYLGNPTVDPHGKKILAN